MRTRLLLLLLINTFSLWGEGTDSPFSQYNYTFLTEDEGLPHNFVDDIYKDSQGYVWIATHNGLARYDGYTYVTFTSSTVPVRLKSNFVRKVCEDNFDRLWVATEEGIDVIDLKQYRNVNFALDKYSPVWNLMHSYTSSLYKDSQGNIWVSSENTLCCIELDKAGEISNYYCLAKEVSHSPVNAVIDVGWSVCAGINNSIVRIDKRENHQLNIEPVSQLVDALYDDWRVFCMQVDGEILWIGTNRGLYRYDHFEQQIKRYGHSYSRSGTLSQSYITDIKLDNDQRLFVSTFNGLNLYNKEEDTFSYLRQDNVHRNSSLNCNFINCLWIDGNSLWIGTEIGGVNLLTPGRLWTYNWQYNSKDEHSLSPNPVNAICEDRDGNLWVGTVEGGLNLKRRGSNRFEHILSNLKDSTTLSHNSVCGILLDSDNHLWVYTWGLGINELDLNIPGNRRFKQYYRGKTANMDGNFVASACEDVINQGIWFGTTEGLHFYDKQQRRFTQVKLGLSDNRFDTMGSLFVDNKNRLWVGTSKGLFIIDLFSFARSRIHFDYVYINHKLSDPEVAIPDKVNCVFQDKAGRIWIGTNGSGLYELQDDKSKPYRFHNYTIRNGLPNENVIGIVEDKNRCLWLSTNRGISKLDKQTMTFSNYTKYDGLLTNQFYWNAYHFSERENRVYFGNMEGLIAIDTNIQDNTMVDVKVSLTGLSISGNAIYPSSGSYLDSYISSAQRVKMHESDRAIVIDFSAKDYRYNSLIRYAYRLQGYEEDWVEPKLGEHTAQYTSIPSGKYIFQVRATDDKGHWMNEITEIPIHVTPYFYKSWWFFCLLAIAIVIVTRRFYVWKTRTYRQQKEVLEKTVEERTSKLAVQNKRLKEISQKLAETTEERIALFTNITHEFRTPVTLINGPLEQAIKKCNEPQVMEQLQIVERSSRYLLGLVNELMDFRKLDANKVQLDKKSACFKDFMEYTLMPFVAFAHERHITLRIYYHLNAEYLVFDYTYLQKVLINLVSNAIKFTPDNGVISVYAATITLSDGRKRLYLNVRDTGSGIADEDLEKIFGRFFQSKKSVKYASSGQSSTGIGLFLCKKIVELHDGEIKACNNKRTGASVRILLPYIIGESAEFSPERKEIYVENAVVQDTPTEQDTILIVDDNVDMRAYIRTLLSRTYHILEAQDGVEALAILQREQVDLILSDLMMPVMDGMELSRRVKSNLSISHIPFLMLTALVSEEQKKISYEIGVDEYLCKPFDEEMLLLRIRNIFALRKKYKSMFAIRMNCDELNINEESKDKKFMTAAINLMKKHYGDSQYELDRFISDLGYSKTLVNRKLQDLTGQSIGQFMRNYRLNVAHELLLKLTAESDMNVAEVAYSVGFNDPKYFTRCFKEFFGVLPSALISKK